METLSTDVLIIGGGFAALETKNLILTSKLVAHAALARTESRGLHQRRDYPLTDNDQWLKWVALQKAGDGVAVFDSPVGALSRPHRTQ